MQAVEMMSVMSSSNDGRAVPPPARLSSAVEEEKSAVSTSEFDFPEDFGFGSVASTDEAARVGGAGSDETRISGNLSDSRLSMLENEKNRFSGSGDSHSVCRLHGSSKNNSSRSGMPEHKKDTSAAEDYDSILSAFDQFAAKGKDETVGYGFKIGDMVWGKVKSHPWWPGHIYNEALASSSVRRGKHEGHVLVAFFGDSSYGWFDPEELILFEENFAEKSKQTTSRSFVKAVEEAADEIARRSSLGLACRCRNEYNFSPSSVDGYFVVDVGDSEAGVYNLSQIREAQDNFLPRDLVSFLHEVALNPMNDDCWSVEFIKQKAAVLDIRKVFFEEFDETYAQAFGTQPMRPPRPTAPVAVDPSKAPLSGPLVIAEALGKGKISVKPAKMKVQMPKEKCILTRRDESVQMKSKKAKSSQVGLSPRQLSVDGPGIRNHVHQASESCFADDQHRPISQQASVDTKPSQNSRKLVESGTKKVKFLKRPAGESTADYAIRVKKKKRKVIGAETGGKHRELPLAVSDNTIARNNVSGMPVRVHPSENSGSEDQKVDADVGLSSSSSSSQSQQEADFAKIELQMLMRDLRDLALNPFHGEKKSCPAVIKQVFLKFRSLVYQKSLALMPSAECEASEGSRLSAPADKTNDKIVKPLVRVDDPTKRGKKRSLPDRLEDVHKRKLGVSEGVKRKKVDDFLDSKKKKNDNFKSLKVEKKILQRSTEAQQWDAGDSDVRVVPATTPLRAVKQESSKRTVQMARSATPTMLFVKFPAGAALPSIPQLKAKFARFGPLDQSATRVFWKSCTCRVVYQHKIDAQAALKFALASSSSLFGNTNVRCYLREVGVEAIDSEPVKPQKEDTPSAVEPRMVAKTASQPQSSAQLKSCLKKPCGDESGNGGGRSARVKFVLGGEVDEVPTNETKKNNVASFGQGASSIHSVDSTSKILPKINAQSRITFSSLFQQPEQEPIRPPAPQTTLSSSRNDISEQMLNLLMRCNDVVNNLSAAFGYMPYYPL